jgi:hypothetical protein
MSRHLLDISSEPNFGGGNVVKNDNKNKNQKVADSPEQRKKFLGVKFHCCGVYDRIYVNGDNTAYVGRCPKCLKPVVLKIGEGGTDSRFFEVF